MFSNEAAGATEAFRDLLNHGNQNSSAVVSRLSADAGLVAEYVQEARDYLVDAEFHLTARGADRDADRSGLEGVLRCVHSIKSGASFLHLTDICRVTQETESLLDFALKGDVQVTPTVHRVLLQAIDVLRTLLTNVEEALAGDGLLYRWAQVDLLVEALRQAFIQQVIGEPTDNKGEFGSPSSPSLIRVEAGKCDQLYSKVLELDGCLAGEGKAAEILAGIKGLAKELRLAPLSSLESALQAVLAQGAARMGKKTGLILLGGESLVSRRTLEGLKEILLQLARNAVAHGIESPKERRKAGKDEEGTFLIVVGAEQGGWFLEVSDDGAGLNRTAILKAAEAVGLSGDPESLIFRPGLTTTAQPDEQSGTGTGLDIVAKGVRRLKGRVEVRSEPGRYTSFMIRLPIEPEVA